MPLPQPIIHFRATPQPVTVLHSGSADVIEVLYIRCLNGRVPECYELWFLLRTEFARFTYALGSSFVLSSGEILFKLSSSVRDNSRFLSWVVEL